ncbi:MAG TPA: MFS transporter [Burkholderiaceae bacterium]|nr:MFS transporter [Burkholderiaceae bacterium]
MASVHAYARGRLAARIFLCFAAAYFMSYALRSVNAVLAPELTVELTLTNAQLGSLTSAYFLAFAAMQLPLGVWLDRFGPRRVDALLLMVAAVGCGLFALATHFGILWLARALIGMGVSAALMAALTAFRQWFPPERQAQLNAWMLMVGTLGVLSATVPVRWALPAIGWRGVFWIAAALLAAAAAAIWLLLPRSREQPEGGVQTFAAAMGGYRQVFRHSHFWRLACTGALVQGSLLALQSLWIGPWLTTVLGFSPERSANIIFLFNLTLMLCYLTIGWVAPRLDSSPAGLVRVVVYSTAALIVFEIGIAIAWGGSAWLLWLGMGGAATLYSMVQPRVALVFPTEIAGRALTAFNLMMFSGVFLMQWGFGIVADVFHAGGLAPDTAFRASMLTLALLHAFGLATIVLWPRWWPDPAIDRAG